MYTASILLCILSVLFSFHSQARVLQPVHSSHDPRSSKKPVQVLSLTRRYGHRSHEADHRAAQLQTANYSTPAFKRYAGLDYSFEILWGNQTLSVEIDTGSSDLWVAQKNFTCLTPAAKVTYRDFCGFGEYVESTKYGGGQIEDENFSIAYGTGFITGTVGYEDITLAGLTVTHQEVAIGYKGYWNGDNVTAGLMGLAYPSITDAYAGRYPLNLSQGSDNAHTFRIYSPWFFTAFKRGLIDPVFSIALQRSRNNEYAGQIAFGGLPNVEFPHEFASVPIKTLDYEQDGKDKHLKDFYALDVDGWVVDGIYHPENRTYREYIVDSGNDGIDVSPHIAHLINSKFSPPANISHGGQVVISCDPASIPSIAVRIGGMDFPIDPSDLVQAAATGYYQRERGFCVSSIGVGGALGDPFLRNVVAVFDVGAAEMRFAKHVY